MYGLSGVRRLHTRCIKTNAIHVINVNGNIIRLKIINLTKLQYQTVRLINQIWLTTLFLPYSLSRVYACLGWQIHSCTLKLTFSFIYFELRHGSYTNNCYFFRVSGKILNALRVAYIYIYNEITVGKHKLVARENECKLKLYSVIAVFERIKWIVSQSRKCGPEMNLDESPNPRARDRCRFLHPRGTTHVAEAVEPPILFILNERFKARRKGKSPGIVMAKSYIFRPRHMLARSAATCPLLRIVCGPFI